MIHQKTSKRSLHRLPRHQWARPPRWRRTIRTRKTAASILISPYRHLAGQWPQPTTEAGMDLSIAQSSHARNVLSNGTRIDSSHIFNTPRAPNKNGAHKGAVFMKKIPGTTASFSGGAAAEKQISELSVRHCRSTNASSDTKAQEHGDTYIATLQAKTAHRVSSIQVRRPHQHLV